jgi:hypothetical protein
MFMTIGNVRQPILRQGQIAEIGAQMMGTADEIRAHYEKLAPECSGQSGTPWYIRPYSSEKNPVIPNVSIRESTRERRMRAA